MLFVLKFIILRGDKKFTFAASVLDAKYAKLAWVIFNKHAVYNSETSSHE